MVLLFKQNTAYYMRISDWSSDACSSGLRPPYKRSTMDILVPVILSGGSGTRLWPVSTSTAPKQFQPLTGGGSMFLETVERTKDRGRFAAPLVVCGRAHIAHVDADPIGRASCRDRVCPYV